MMYTDIVGRIPVRKVKKIELSSGNEKSNKISSVSSGQISSMKNPNTGVLCKLSKPTKLTSLDSLKPVPKFISDSPSITFTGATSEQCLSKKKPKPVVSH